MSRLVIGFAVRQRKTAQSTPPHSMFQSRQRLTQVLRPKQAAPHLLLQHTNDLRMCCKSWTENRQLVGKIMNVEKWQRSQVGIVIVEKTVITYIQTFKKRNPKAKTFGNQKSKASEYKTPQEQGYTPRGCVYKYWTFCLYIFLPEGLLFASSLDNTITIFHWFIDWLVGWLMMD